MVVIKSGAMAWSIVVLLVAVLMLVVYSRLRGRIG